MSEKTHEQSVQNSKATNKSSKLSLENDLRDIFSLKPSQALVLTLFAAILFTITGVWQLIVLAGFLGGFFTKHAKMGALVGFMGAFLGWMILFAYYALTTEMLYFFEFWLVETMGFTIEWLYLLWFFSSVCGGIIGGLGGINGVLISRMFIEKLSHSRTFS